MGKYALLAFSAHSSNQYISYRYSEQLFPRALISCQQMGILAACQRAYIKTNTARQTQQQCVILSLYKWFLQTTAQCWTKRPVRTEGKNVKTWLGLRIELREHWTWLKGLFSFLSAWCLFSRFLPIMTIVWVQFSPLNWTIFNLVEALLSNTHTHIQGYQLSPTMTWRYKPATDSSYMSRNNCNNNYTQTF